MYFLLNRLRSKLAQDLDVVPYMIASNIALNQIIQSKPNTLEELRSCKLDGFYEAKYLRFGNEFLKCIQETINKCTECQHSENNNNNSEEKDALETNEKHSNDELWENESIDADLSQIGDEVEKQLQSSGSIIMEDNNGESELDLLLADLETVQKENLNENSNDKPQSSTDKKSNIHATSLMLKRKPIYQYEDSSDEDDSENKPEEVKNSNTTHISIKAEVSNTSKPIQKQRILPAWMKSKR